MSEAQELALPAGVLGPLEKLYWMFPLTEYVYAKGSTDKLEQLPLAPRAAPLRQIESAAELLGHPIPDWVVALWSCQLMYLDAYADQEPSELGRYIVEVDRTAHAEGAPPEVVFFAGCSSLRPGTKSYSTAKGERFVKGVLDGFVYGFEPAASGAPRIVEYDQTPHNPAAVRLQHLDLIEYLKDHYRGALNSDDTDVYSKETYRDLVALRKRKRPPFQLLWETKTPGIPRLAPAGAARSEAGAALVKHAKYGVGTVMAREGAGESAKLTIAFAEGTKVILARFVQPAADD